MLTLADKTKLVDEMLDKNPNVSIKAYLAEVESIESEMKQVAWRQGYSKAVQKRIEYNLNKRKASWNAYLGK